MALLTSVLLVSARLGALFMMTPLFAFGQVPLRFRVLFILMLSLLLVMALQVPLVDTPHSFSALLVAVVCEAVLGAAMGFGVLAAFAAFTFGGRLLDFQIGFGLAGMIDPSSNEQAPLFGMLLNMMAVLTFFLLDGHHMMLRGVTYSLAQLPPGMASHTINIEVIVAQFGLMFVYGLAVVAPPVFVLLLLDFGMAMAARTMPQVNMFIFAFPIKIFVGLLVLAMSLNYMGPLLEKIYASIFRFWESYIG